MGQASRPHVRRDRRPALARDQHTDHERDHDPEGRITRGREKLLRQQRHHHFGIGQPRKRERGEHEAQHRSGKGDIDRRGAQQHHTKIVPQISELPFGPMPPSAHGGRGCEDGPCHLAGCAKPLPSPVFSVPCGRGDGASICRRIRRRLSKEIVQLRFRHLAQFRFAIVQ